MTRALGRDRLTAVQCTHTVKPYVGVSEGAGVSACGSATGTWFVVPWDLTSRPARAKRKVTTSMLVFRWARQELFHARFVIRLITFAKSRLFVSDANSHICSFQTKNSENYYNALKVSILNHPVTFFRAKWALHEFKSNLAQVLHLRARKLCSLMSLMGEIFYLYQEYGGANFFDNIMQIGRLWAKKTLFTLIFLNGVNFKLYAIFMARCHLQSSNGHQGISKHKYFSQNRPLIQFSTKTCQSWGWPASYRMQGETRLDHLLHFIRDICKM